MGENIFILYLPTTVGVMASVTGLYSSSSTFKVGSVNKYGYTLICNLVELKEREGLKVKVNSKSLAVFKVGENVHIIKNSCAHQAIPLDAGVVEDFKGNPCVICPGHGLKINLIDGKFNIKKYTQRVYKSKVKNGLVWAKLS